MSASAAVGQLNDLGAADMSMMIQPFMSNIILEGEFSVLMFDGQFSHAIRSNTAPDDFRVQFEYGGVTTPVDQPSIEMLTLAHDVLAACHETPIYARVDMIRNHLTGQLCIIELELIEPNLFLHEATDEGMAFACAILHALSRNISFEKK